MDGRVMMKDHSEAQSHPKTAAPRLGRRGFLRWTAGWVVLLLLGRREARAAVELAKEPPPEHSLEERLNPILRGRTPKAQRVTLELPPLAEDGRVVPVRITVDSPMTDKDFVRRLHLLVDRNPDPKILAIDSSPAMGTEWNVKIRMRESSNVRVIAEMSDGSLYGAEVAILVNRGGCE